MENRFKFKVSDINWSFIGTESVVLHTKVESFQPNQFVKLQNKDSIIVGKVAKIERDNKNVIEIDSFLRDNLSVSLGGFVEAEQVTDIQDAIDVTISVPFDMDSSIDIKKYITGKVVTEGMRYPLLKEGVTITVFKTTPVGIVRISDATNLLLSESNSEIISAVPQKHQNSPYKELPTITFADIGGLESVKQILTENIIKPIRNPNIFNKIGYKPMKGILLFGPPGTGKTILAKATAKESGAKFISISASSFKDKWYGQSEQKMREAFGNARKNQPCILFIDEIDAVAESRIDSKINVVNQLLTLMDEIQDEQIYVIAATNMLESIDKALIRPGRFNPLEVGYPTKEDRARIFRLYLSGTKITDKEIKDLLEITENYSGARIFDVCNKAKLIASRNSNYSETAEVKFCHLSEAIRFKKDDYQPQYQ